MLILHQLCTKFKTDHWSPLCLVWFDIISLTTMHIGSKRELIGNIWSRFIKTKLVLERVRSFFQDL